MHDDWIEEVIADIRSGQTEESWLELKEAWWDLKNPKSRAEFLKDVAGLANAQCDQGRRRIILVGVSEDGRCTEAKMPMGEADLQQVVGAIDPLPTVDFRHVDIEGTIITVIEVRSPYDRPYVAPYDNRNIVFVRTGSRVGTASRRALDRMYTERAPGHREPDLYLELVGEGEPVVIHTAPSTSHDHFLDILRSDISDAEELLKDAHLRPEERQRLEPWIEQAHRFCEEMEDSEQHRLWTMEGREGTAVRVRLWNDGDLPATGISVQLELPDWLLPSTSESLGPKYKGPKRPSSAFLETLMYEIGIRKGDSRTGWDALLRGIALSTPSPLGALFGLGLDGYEPKIEPAIATLPHFAPLPGGRPVRSTWIDVEGQVVTVRRDQLSHRHEWSSDQIWLFAKAEAPIGDQELVAKVFAKELRDWVTRQIIVRIE